MTRAILKAVLRRTQKMWADTQYAAHMDAGFDAGEWSGPAHMEMLDERTEEILSRFSREEVAQLSQAEAHLMNVGHCPRDRYTDHFDVTVLGR